MSVILTGLDGSNPLGFLAALGLLAVGPDTWKLRWIEQGTWVPELEGVDDRDTLLEVLWQDVSRWRDAPALGLTYDGKQDLKPSPEVFRDWWGALPEGATGRGLAGSFGVPEVTDNNGAVKPNALHFTAGQQQFLKMAHELRFGLERADLENALVGPWRADRPLPSFSWDASVRRDYALRASDPSTDKRAGVPGADWLALMGWALIPVFPVRGRLVTTGCTGGWKDGTFRWPLWGVALGQRTVRALLAHPQHPAAWAGRGVVEVFESSILRSAQGGYGSFTPSRAVLADQPAAS